MRTALGLLALSWLAGACSPASEHSAEAESPPPSLITASCSGCHAAEGKAIAGLEGRSAIELRAALMRYKSEENGRTVMHRIARGFSDAEITEISSALGKADGGSK